MVEVFHDLGFWAVSVGSSLPAFYALMLHKILEDKKPKLFDITCYCLKNVVDFQCQLRVLYSHFDDFQSETEGFFLKQLYERVVYIFSKKMQWISMVTKNCYAVLCYEVVDTVAHQVAKMC